MLKWFAILPPTSYVTGLSGCQTTKHQENANTCKTTFSRSLGSTCGNLMGWCIFIAVVSGLFPWLSSTPSVRNMLFPVICLAIQVSVDLGFSTTFKKTIRVWLKYGTPPKTPFDISWEQTIQLRDGFSLTHIHPRVSRHDLAQHFFWGVRSLHFHSFPNYINVQSHMINHDQTQWLLPGSTLRKNTPRNIYLFQGFAATANCFPGCLS